MSASNHQIAAVLALICLLTPRPWAKSPGKNPSIQDIIQNAAGLEAGIRALHPPNVGGQLGLSVYSVKHQKFKTAINADAVMTPASCLKALVTAAAIDKYPVNHFPQTVIMLRGRLTGNTFEGIIRVRGEGDPNISGRFFETPLTVLESWTSKLKNLGIDTLVGGVEVDDTYFSSPYRPDVWEARHFDRWYGAEISALNYNDNCFKVYIQPGDSLYHPINAEVYPDIGYVKLVNNAITVPGNRNHIQFVLHPDSNLLILTGLLGQKQSLFKKVFPVRGPPQYFKRAFTTILNSRIHIKKSQNQLSFSNLPEYKTISLSTVPLINILEEINQRSQNLHAEIMLRSLGIAYGFEGTPQGGIQAEKLFLHQLGLDSASFAIFDGSGLSTFNKVTPSGMSLLLAKMARHRYSHDYIQTLATPGMHGARAYRLNHLNNLLKLKTGFINGIQGLCGYVFSSDNDTLAVSIFLNNYKVNHYKAQKAVDSLMAFIAYWHNRERSSLKQAESLLANPSIPDNYIDRLIFFSKRLRGKPYFPGPTGEGHGGKYDKKPLLELFRFDCVTYIESVMALALANSASDIIPVLNDIRYIDSKISFRTRKHFFIEDWVKKNQNYVKPFRFPNDTTSVRTTGKRRFFKNKNITLALPDPETELSFVPYNTAVELIENWNFGKLFLGVGFVTSLDWLWISHTGFLDATLGRRPKLRHASSLKKKVIEQDFLEYLLSRKGKCLGVFFFEFEDQSLL